MQIFPISKIFTNIPNIQNIYKYSQYPKWYLEIFPISKILTNIPNIQNIYKYSPYPKWYLEICPISKMRATYIYKYSQYPKWGREMSQKRGSPDVWTAGIRQPTHKTHIPTRGYCLQSLYYRQISNLISWMSPLLPDLDDQDLIRLILQDIQSSSRAWGSPWKVGYLYVTFRELHVLMIFSPQYFLISYQISHIFMF